MASRRGRSGDDILNGTAQRDLLSGLNGDDRLYGRDGDDRMAGGLGRDYLNGGKGADVLRGDAGDDRLYGDVGSDTLYGGADRDALYGGSGADRLEGGLGGDSLRGGDGNDILLGQAGDDRLFGERGNDVLDGGLGRDVLRGGEGADRLVYDAQDILLHGDAGRDTLVIGGSAVTLDFNQLAAPGIKGIEVIDLNGSGANTLRLDAADVLELNGQHSLLVMGGADDAVISPTDIWSQNFAGAVDIDGQHYLAWDAGAAHLLVDADISLNNLTQNGSQFAQFLNTSFVAGDSLGLWGVFEPRLEPELDASIPPV
ncbi:MAG: calcium-binding protein [Proteobacteria bacterium]|jgi:Ca2+-binding RTX toxin-like protein|nr:calcium-binding protein [Pseudomonadota bacterium]